MKKLLLTTVLCCSAMAMMAQNTISVKAASGAPGETVTITLDMSTPGVSDVCAFQCDVVLPDGVTLADPENLVLSSRKDDHTIASNLLEGNKYRLLCYSMTNAVIKETSGEIVSFDVVAPSTEASYTFEVENVEIVSLKDITALVASGVSGKLTVENGGVYGDVTGEGIVNASDISFVIRCIKESDPSGDVTGEGIVNASDISAIISVILNK